jgi:hypothetical protein
MDQSDARVPFPSYVSNSWMCQQLRVKFASSNTTVVILLQRKIEHTSTYDFYFKLYELWPTQKIENIPRFFFFCVYFFLWNLYRMCRHSYDSCKDNEPMKQSFGLAYQAMQQLRNVSRSKCTELVVPRISLRCKLWTMLGVSCGTLEHITTVCAETCYHRVHTQG